MPPSVLDVQAPLQQRAAGCEHGSARGNESEAADARHSPARSAAGRATRAGRAKEGAGFAAASDSAGPPQAPFENLDFSGGRRGAVRDDVRAGRLLAAHGTAHREIIVAWSLTGGRHRGRARATASGHRDEAPNAHQARGSGHHATTRDGDRGLPQTVHRSGQRPIRLHATTPRARHDGLLHMLHRAATRWRNWTWPRRPRLPARPRLAGAVTAGSHASGRRHGSMAAWQHGSASTRPESPETPCSPGRSEQPRLGRKNSLFAVSTATGAQRRAGEAAQHRANPSAMAMPPACHALLPVPAVRVEFHPAHPAAVVVAVVAAQ